MTDRPGLPLTTGEGNTAVDLAKAYELLTPDEYGTVSFTDLAVWFHQNGHALLAECGRLREQLDAANAKIISLATDFLNEQGTARELREQLDAATGALRYTEWIWDEATETNLCPACGLSEQRGHDRSCRIAAALGVEGPAAGDGQP